MDRRRTPVLSAKHFATLHGLWRYRVRDFRIICELRDARLVVLGVGVGETSTTSCSAHRAAMPTEGAACNAQSEAQLRVGRPRKNLQLDRAATQRSCLRQSPSSPRTEAKPEDRLAKPGMAASISAGSFRKCTQPEQTSRARGVSARAGRAASADRPRRCRQSFVQSLIGSGFPSRKRTPRPTGRNRGLR